MTCRLAAMSGSIQGKFWLWWPIACPCSFWAFPVSGNKLILMCFGTCAFLNGKWYGFRFKGVVKSEWLRLWFRYRAINKVCLNYDTVCLYGSLNSLIWWINSFSMLQSLALLPSSIFSFHCIFLFASRCDVWRFATSSCFRRWLCVRRNRRQRFFLGVNGVVLQFYKFSYFVCSSRCPLLRRSPYSGKLFLKVHPPGDECSLSVFRLGVTV